ncbi:MAG TPA: FAD-dependent monooxygenase, partial [Methyloceanibacter sp.]|nr:FAD-dependent monooxygenase [Methyloceanibacter sp.]
MTIPQGRILVAGGGIGGLSAAIALARRGIESEVLERSLFGEETGAGIQLGPNATRLLREIGVLDAIAPSAFSPESILIYDGLSGRNLGAVPLGAHIERRYGAPYLTLHRADLHAGLHSVAQALAAVTLRPGFDIAAIDMQSAGIVLRAADGSHAAGKGLIGADGLWSTVRTLIAPEARLRFTGQTAWRTLLPRRGLPPPFDAPAVG